MGKYIPSSFLDYSINNLSLATWLLDVQYDWIWEYNIVISPSSLEEERTTMKERDRQAEKWQ